MVAWSSFSDQYVASDTGSLSFELSGDSGVIFDRPVDGIGFASAVSTNVSGRCSQTTLYSYDALSATLTLTVSLLKDGGCSDPLSACVSNPCPGTLAPQAWGYDTVAASTPQLTLDISMSAVTTALAVNMGMRKLSTLIKVGRWVVWIEFLVAH